LINLASLMKRRYSLSHAEGADGSDILTG